MTRATVESIEFSLERELASLELPTERRTELLATPIVLLPNRRAIGTDEMCFPDGTREFLISAREHGRVALDVASQTESVELAEHSEEWRLPLVFLAEALMQPLLIEMLKHYIAERLSGLLPGQVATVKSEVRIKNADGALSVKFEGPATEFVEALDIATRPILPPPEDG